MNALRCASPEMMNYGSDDSPFTCVARFRRAISPAGRRFLFVIAGRDWPRIREAGKRDDTRLCIGLTIGRL